MKDTSNKHSLWKRSTSDEEIMYKAWSVHSAEQQDVNNNWDQVKLSLSRFPGDDQERVPTATKVENQDQVRHSEQKISLNGGLKTEAGEKEMERPQFQITIEQPIRHVTPSCNVTFPLWSKPRSMYGNGRRASDGLLATSVPFSGRNAAVFSPLSEEHSVNQANEDDSCINGTYNCNSGVSSINCRRFSDGCVRSVPVYKEYKKVSVVLPQPRRSVKEEVATSRSTNDGTSDKDVKHFENADCSRNEEDDRWKELVAKAQGFKSVKANGASKLGSLRVEDVKGNISRSLEMEEVYSDVSSEASFSSNSSYHSLSESDSAVYSALTLKPISGELTNYKAEGHTSVTSNAGSTICRASLQPSLSSNSSKPHPRRYSVATVSPSRSFDPTKTAKLSGYSTQSALEQARQLLTKLQSEGKNKNKKERLEELSRALKWILEELNRIETPDKELVSLFISLRAKIVNLKAELKTEEFDATSIDPAEEIDSAPRLQKLMTEDSVTNARSRRFSWC